MDAGKLCTHCTCVKMFLTKKRKKPSPWGTEGRLGSLRMREKPLIRCCRRRSGVADGDQALQTASTLSSVVLPWMDFSIPSIRRVVMPPSSARVLMRSAVALL